MLQPWLTQRSGAVAVKGPLGTWTERAAAAVQLQDIALGFRLQLHAPHEFRMLYWCGVASRATSASLLNCAHRVVGHHLMQHRGTA